ncbi:signal peptide peptidase SppA [Glacieibacterium megasporae]|uniref:signal peptide peptidase SppA n=1 Tax=Glacieibacterium megasporae TaxID=2835787 RepID=UPI001C1DE29B|nr:signal peptide peptidase SppA [Polymorphobacter megasporae]UAJ09339.1 signal peptide peptidase SppA [Polymorphobacter megasporae]
MTFVRGAWRFLVGVKDLGVLILLLILALAIWAAFHTRTASIPNGSALVLDLDGPVVDQSSERSPFAAVTGGPTGGNEIEVRDVVRSIDAARTDGRIKLIVLQLDTFIGAGEANLQSIAAALQNFKRSGKPVYAYATAYTDASYYLAAQANHAWINPLGGVLLTGPGGTNLYFKKALDKLDVDINVFRVGKYKSFVEPFTRTEASPEAKAAEQALVDGLWKTYTADVHAARPNVDVTAAFANLPARIKAANGDFAKEALDAHLIDQIGTRVAFGQTIAKLVGTGDDKQPGAFNGVRLDTYANATKPNRSGPAVGIVYIAGNIVDGEAGAGTAGGDTIAKLVAKALTNSDIKALVVRIDSPGGSVLASERIREALAQATAKGLPVIASMGPVAASGGYWVSTAASQVFAQPSTITGSIGVFAVIPTFNRALDKLGITTDATKSTPYTGDPDILRGLTPDSATILQASIDDVYRRFTGLVATARHLPIARVDEIAQGRVWTGADALNLKLVDHLGGLDAAVAAAGRAAKLGDTPRTIDVEKTPSLLFQLVGQSLGLGGGDDDQARARDPFAKIAAASRARIFGAIGEAAAIAGGSTIQAHCLDCSTLAPPRPANIARSADWLATASAAIR